MGTRINALFAHELDWTDRSQTLETLSRGLAYDDAIGDYWVSAGELPTKRVGEWISKPPFPPPETRRYHRYTSPNGLFVQINPRTVHVRTSARWSGFLSIKPLRDVHWAALRGLAMLFHAPEIWYLGDDDFAIDVFWDGGTVTECIRARTDRVGPPEPMPNELDPTVAAATRYGPPAIWYHESLVYDAEQRVQRNPQAR